MFTDLHSIHFAERKGYFIDLKITVLQNWNYKMVQIPS